MSHKQNFRIYDRDDRGSGSNHNVRKVSFKGYYGRVQKPKRGDNKVREKYMARLKLDDDDVIMSNAGGAPRFRRTKRRNFKGRAGSPDVRRTALRPSDLYKVTIQYGNMFEKNDLLQLLLKHISPQPLIPLYYANMGTYIVFYVDDMKTAQLLSDASMKLQLPNGHNMTIRVQEGRPPNLPINSELKEKMKVVMAKRYIADNKALDLCMFHKDPDLAPDFYCPLSRPQVLKMALQIIGENIPDLYALDLTGNKIHTLEESPSSEFQKLKNLRILHLKNNSIKNINALNCLKGMEITELVLKDNPIVQSFSNSAQFVSVIRKRFPKLVKLDDAELPPVISFDVGEDAKLPTPQASFMCNPDGIGIVREFLSQYFALFDSDKRCDLLQAYQDKAHFSQCTYYHASQYSYSNSRLGNYIQESRNLFKLMDYPRRKNRLHFGKVNIIKYLEQLPKTQHDLSSFVVDLTLFTPALINLSVNGVYREPHPYTSAATWPVRHFSRTFLIVPVGQGFCIINDSLFITNATEEEKASSFKEETQDAAILQSPSTSQTVSAPQVPLDDSVRLQMVQTLAAQTGMNLEWSKKCLDETQWNFERAVWTFTELRNHGTIPAEAFVK